MGPYVFYGLASTQRLKKVVYTSSASTVMFSGKDLRLVDETSWTDVDFVRSMKSSAASYYISKTLTETSALEFAETHGLDFVTIIPSFVHGPFITPNCPGSVRTSMAMVFGSEKQIKFYANTNFVHVEDVVSAHIFLLENPTVNGGTFVMRLIKIMMRYTNLFQLDILNIKYHQLLS